MRHLPILLPHPTSMGRGLSPFPPILVRGHIPVFQPPRTSVTRGATTNSTGNYGIPAIVSNLAAAVSATTALDTITVTFSRAADQYFAGVNLYTLPSGSVGSPLLVASSADAPIIFTIANPATGTKVSLFAQSINSAGQGAAVTSCPSVIITL